MTSTVRNILVVRNYKLGDFMLAWPAIALLKQQYPDSTATALVSDYTKPIAERCPWIDELLIDSKNPSFVKDVIELARKIAHRGFDYSISSNWKARTSLALFLARVPKRYGPASKIAQVFLNRRLAQRRSRSLKPEYEYNLDLAQHCIVDNGGIPVNVPAPPFLPVDEKTTAGIKNDFIASNNIPANCKLVAIHTGSGGSANNLSLEQYRKLAHLLNECERISITITAGPGESDLTNALSRMLADIDDMVYRSTRGLVEFSVFLTIFDIYISGSTGVLHIAGALEIPTAAFYARHRSAAALRWQRANSEPNRLAFSPPLSAAKEDIASVDLSSAADTICRHLRQAGRS